MKFTYKDIILTIVIFILIYMILWINNLLCLKKGYVNLFVLILITILIMTIYMLFKNSICSYIVWICSTDQEVFTDVADF